MATIIVGARWYETTIRAKAQASEGRVWDTSIALEINADASTTFYLTREQAETIVSELQAALKAADEMKKAPAVAATGAGRAG